MDDINVFDYAPGLHIATITVNDTLGSSAGESFTFLTPEAIGRQSGIVHKYLRMLCGDVIGRWGIKLGTKWRKYCVAGKFGGNFIWWIDRRSIMNIG